MQDLPQVLTARFSPVAPSPRIYRSASSTPRFSTKVPESPNLWKYRTPRQPRGSLITAILISVGLHAFALLGFNRHAPPPKVVHIEDENVIQMTMPDLDEEEEKPVEALSDEQAEETPGINVPMLADIPTIVPVNAFVQPLDFRPTVQTNIDASGLASIPVNIARGGNVAAKLGKIFDVSQLDRQPQAIVQPPPVFPRELTKIYTESVVVLEFIITAKGEVVDPKSISSENRRFEDAAEIGVLKWKFRPGYKAGRPVNTRVRISIKFRVTNQD